MVELTWVPEAIRAFFWLYIITAVIALILAMVKPKTMLLRVVWSSVVLLVFVGLPYFKLKDNKAETALKESNEIYKAKLAVAEAAFNEHCKSSGEKVNKTVEGIEGVFWMKYRPISSNQGDQFKLDDPYGHDCSEEHCIRGLLKVSKGAELNPKEAQEHSKGFTYVEAIDPQDNQLYRYIGVLKPKSTWTQEKLEAYYKKLDRPIDPSDYGFGLERELITKNAAQYGITWEDLSTQEDRQKWIAGSTLQILDLKNNEVIAERIGYMMDRGQGSRGGFRAPWQMALRNACPAFSDGQRTYQAMPKFVFKYLIPAEEK